MPDFILLFTNFNDICTISRPNLQTQQFMFHATNSTGHLQAFDITELTSTKSSDPFLRFFNLLIFQVLILMLFLILVLPSQLPPLLVILFLWETPSQPPRLCGVSDEPDVHGVGIVEFKVCDDNNSLQTLRTRAYYVPQS